MKFDDIAIVGAGISGLTFALLLKKHGFHVTLYESRSPDASSEGAITLAPNGLRTLDAIGAGVADRICSKGYGFQNLTFRSENHEYLDSYEVGSKERFGYEAYRIYRQIVLRELRALVKQAGIPIFYNQKCTHVISEDATTVTFKLADGTERTTNLLIGADGIHSIVRQFLLPDLVPTWSGAVAVSCAAPTASIAFPDEEYAQKLPASIHGPTGAVHLAPQNEPGTEVVVAVQWITEERSREGWEKLNDDKAQLRKVTEDLGGFNELTKSATAAAPDDTFTIWPFYTVPRLTKWSSEGGKVVILGDGAHAIPPTGGQGANQALEDVYMLSLLMIAIRDGAADWETSLKWWQQVLQERVAKVIELAGEIRTRRMPGWTGEGAGNLDGSWLYSVSIDEMVKQWVKQQSLIPEFRVKNVRSG